MSPTTPAPARSLVQRMEALENANHVRTVRSAYKRDLKAGRASLLETLIDPPEWLYTAKVFDLMLAVPKYGSVKVNKVLQVCRISPGKTVAGLSDRQRQELLVRLGATPAQLTRLSAIPLRLPTRRLFPSSNAGRGAPGTDPTNFQMMVLREAHHFGDVGPAFIDEIARRLETSTSGIGLARHALHRFGFINDFGAPTDRGLACLRDIDGDLRTARPPATLAA